MTATLSGRDCPSMKEALCLLHRCVIDQSNAHPLRTAAHRLGGRVIITEFRELKLSQRPPDSGTCGPGRRKRKTVAAALNAQMG